MSVQTRYSVGGMSCGGCAKKLRKSLENLPGFVDVDIEPKAGRVDLTSSESPAESEVKQLVETAGFSFAGAVQ